MSSVVGVVAQWKRTAGLLYVSSKKLLRWGGGVAFQLLANDCHEKLFWYAACDVAFHLVANYRRENLLRHLWHGFSSSRELFPCKTKQSAACCVAFHLVANYCHVSRVSVRAHLLPRPGGCCRLLLLPPIQHKGYG